MQKHKDLLKNGSRRLLAWLLSFACTVTCLTWLPSEKVTATAEEGQVIVAQGCWGEGADATNIIWTLTKKTSEQDLLLTISGSGTIGERTIDSSTSTSWEPWIAYNEYITEISFEGNISEIPAGRFKGTKATKISIGPLVEVIGANAFAESNVSEVDFSKAENLIEVGVKAFYKSKITTVDLRNSKRLEVIGLSAFERNQELETVRLPEDGVLKKIGSGAFFNPSGCVKQINIPDSVTDLAYQFIDYNMDDTESSYYKAVVASRDPENGHNGDGCVYFGKSLHDYVGPDPKSNPHTAKTKIELTVMEGTTSICDTAFEEDSRTLCDEYYTACLADITKLELPSSLVKIGNAAFAKMSSLAEVTIPSENSLSEVGRNIFGNVKRENTAEHAYRVCDYEYQSEVVPYLRNYIQVMYNDEGIKDLEFMCLGNIIIYYLGKEGNGDVDHPKELIIPSVLNGSENKTVDDTFHDEAVTYTYSIPTVEVRGIADYVFARSSIDFPNGAIELPNVDYPFFTSVSLPNTVVRIGKGAFANWNGENQYISELMFSGSVEYIGDYAFYNNDKMKCDSLFLKKDENGKWVPLADNLPEDFSISHIGTEAFRGNKNLISGIISKATEEKWTTVEINLPYGVQEIGEKAFESAFYQTYEGGVSLTIPQTVEKVGNKAFASSYGLTEIYYAASKYEIPAECFQYSTKLKHITFIKEIAHIGDSAFLGCNVLNNVELPYAVSVGKSAFKNCYSLDSIVAPKLQYVGSSCFENALISETKRLIIGKVLVHDKTAPQAGVLRLPDGVEYIAGNALKDNDYLSSSYTIVLPDSVKAIGYMSLACDARTFSLPCSIQYWAMNALPSGSQIIYPSGEATEKNAKLLGYNETNSNVGETREHGSAVIVSENTLKSAATCTAKAVYYKSCSACGKLKQDETFTYGDKVAHSMTHHAKVEATCTATGNKEYWHCSTCNTDYADASGATTFTVANPKTILMCAHVYKEIVKANALKSAATCTAKAVYYKSCSACGKLKQDETFTYGDKVAHSMTHHAKVEATYTATGIKEYWHCSKCNTDYADASGTTTFTVANPKTISIKSIAAPVISSVANATTGIIVKWKKVTGATGYYVYEYVGSTLKKKYTITSGSTVSYADTAANTIGTNYTYKVQAFAKNTAGKVVNSSSASAGKSIKKLARPTVTAANLSTGVKITWNKVKGATGYIVYKGSSVLKKITSGSVLTFTDTAAKTNGTKYTYKVYATYGSTKSVVSLTTTTYYVSRPSIANLANSAAKTMTVRWNKNSKAAGYQLQYSTVSSFSSKKTVTITSCNTVSKVIKSLTKGKKYYVRVRAYKTVNGVKYYSDWSAKKSVIIKK